MSATIVTTNRHTQASDKPCAIRHVRSITNLDPSHRMVGCVAPPHCSSLSHHLLSVVRVTNPTMVTRCGLVWSSASRYIRAAVTVGL